MDISNAMGGKKAPGKNPKQFLASITGLTANPTHGDAAQTGVALTAIASGFRGPPPLTIGYQWHTVETGPIVGATSATFTPDAATDDLKQLYCRISPAGMPGRNTPTVIIRDIPPVAANALVDEIFDVGSGQQSIDASGEFTGARLTYAVAGGATNIGISSGIISVDTDVADAGNVVTVMASNSGGTATSAFNLTIEDQANPPMAFLPEDWALSGPRGNRTDISIFRLPGPVTDIEASANGGPWVSLAATSPGTYPLAGLPPESGNRITIRPVDGTAGDISDAKHVLTVPTDDRDFRGWGSRRNHGTAGDIFVAPYGFDTAAGTEADPFETISHAMSVAAPGQEIKVRAGTYREKVIVDKPVTLEGYDIEKPHITALDPLPGLTQCSAADAGIIGSTLGVSASPVFKASIPKTAVEHGAHFLGLNLHEAGEQMHIATDRADLTSRFVEKRPADYHTADNFLLNGSNQITGIVDAAVINASKYTDAQLMAAQVFVLNAPNQIRPANITGANVAGNTLNIDGGWTIQDVSTRYPDPKLYAIINIAPALAPGTFAVLDNGPMLDVYVYPRDPANIDSIEFAARTNCIAIDTGVSDITIRGLQVSGASGRSLGRSDGINIHQNRGTRANNVTLDNILCSGTISADDPNASTSRGLHLQDCDNATISRSTCYGIKGVGASIFGVGASSAAGGLIEKCYFAKLQNDAVSSFFVKEYVFAHSYMTQIGLTAHSSKTKVYGTGGSENNSDICFWGLEFGPVCNGSLVWQRSSAPVVAFCVVPSFWDPADTDGRAILDSNYGVDAAGPIANSKGYVFNNVVPPVAGYAYPGYAIDLARGADGANGMTYTVNNNVAGSINDADDYANPPDSVRGNVITSFATAFGQGIGQFDASNVSATNLFAVYDDLANEVYSHPDGSPVHTTAGIDMSADIAIISARFPRFQGFDRDYKDQVISWVDPFVGADAALAFDHGAVPGAPMLNLPSGAATSATGAALSLSTNQDNGSLSYGVWPETATPSAADIQAGTGAVAHFVTPITTSGPLGPYAITGLSAATTYRAHFYHENSAGNGAAASSASFTTSASGNAELAPDPGFDDPSQWTTQTGATMSGGILEIGAAVPSFGSVSQKSGYRTPVESGKTYTVTINVTEVAAEGRLRILLGGVVVINLNTITAPGVYVGTFNAAATEDVTATVNKVGTALSCKLTSLSIQES